MEFASPMFALVISNNLPYRVQLPIMLIILASLFPLFRIHFNNKPTALELPSSNTNLIKTELSFKLDASLILFTKQSLSALNKSDKTLSMVLQHGLSSRRPMIRPLVSLLEHSWSNKESSSADNVSKPERIHMTSSHATSNSPISWIRLRRHPTELMSKSHLTRLELMLLNSLSNWYQS